MADSADQPVPNPAEVCPDCGGEKSPHQRRCYACGRAADTIYRWTQDYYDPGGAGDRSRARRRSAEGLSQVFVGGLPYD